MTKKEKEKDEIDAHTQIAIFFLFSFFFFILSHLHRYVKRDTGLDFQIKQEDRGRSRNGKCHSAIRRKLKGHSVLAVAGETWILWDRNAVV